MSAATEEDQLRFIMRSVGNALRKIQFGVDGAALGSLLIDAADGNVRLDSLDETKSGKRKPITPELPGRRLTRIK